MSFLNGYGEFLILLGGIFAVVFTVGMLEAHKPIGERAMDALKSAAGITWTAVYVSIGFVVFAFILSAILPPGCAQGWGDSDL